MLPLLLLLVPSIFGAYAPDLVQNLPGLNFVPSFSHYSGYLQVGNTKMFHYWLTESMQNPSTDPLILWLNGGPGCSSVGGLIEENGPFHISDFGNTVYLNKYAWNTFANVLYIESPVGVGYSYATDGRVATDDDQVALDNYNALLAFFGKFPEYKGRDFYITGESYAGIYLPTLGENLIKDKVNFPNFKGMAIGNGYIDVRDDYNTLIPLFYYHGMVRDELYIRIRNQCCNGNIETCDIEAEIISDHACSKMINEALNADANIDPYNIYDTCYIDGVQVESKKLFIRNYKRSKMGLPPIKAIPAIYATNNATITPLCAQTSNTQTYMNRADVRTALHIPSSMHKWADCSNKVSMEYQQIYQNMYKQVADVNAVVKVLIYNGDVDTVCNLAMNMQFVTNLNRTILGHERVNQPWTYVHETPNVAGMIVQYSGNLDFVTVRGSGHFVPGDRPRESLQMIYNWIHGIDYSTPIPF